MNFIKGPLDTNDEEDRAFEGIVHVIDAFI